MKDKRDEIISELLTEVINHDTTSYFHTIMIMVAKNPWLVANLGEYNLRHLIDKCFWCVEETFYTSMAVSFMLAVPRSDLEEHISYLLNNGPYGDNAIKVMSRSLNGTKLEGIIESVLVRKELGNER